MKFQSVIMCACLLACPQLGFALGLGAGVEPEQTGTQKEWDARITETEGDVFMRASDMEENSWVEADTDTVLYAGDSIRTGYESRTELSFDGENIFEVGPNSIFTVESIERKDSSFSLSLGTFFAKIASLLKGHRISVKTPTAVTAVRGTEFAVEYEGEGKPTRVGVFEEGAVLVRGFGPGKKLGRAIKLKKGYETEIFFGKRPIRPIKLKRLLRHKARIKRLRQRRLAIRKAWKRLNLKRRMEIRRRLHLKKALRRKPLLERFKKARERRRQLKKRIQDGKRRRKEERFDRKRIRKRQELRRKSRGI